MERLESSFTYFGHKYWGSKDRLRLMLAYQHGADLMTISRIVNRSPTAANKALTRFGIRQKFGKRCDQRKNQIFKMKDLSFEELKFVIESQIEKFAIDMGDDYGNPARKKKFEFGKPILDSSFFHKKQTVGLEAEICLKKKQLMLEGIKADLKIKPFKNSIFNSKGYTYLLDTQPLTEAQLLVHINTLRRNNGLPIYCVNGITYE